METGIVSLYSIVIDVKSVNQLINARDDTRKDQLIVHSDSNLHEMKVKNTL